MFYAIAFKVCGQYEGHWHANVSRRLPAIWFQVGNFQTTISLRLHALYLTNSVSELHCASPCCLGNQRVSFSMPWLPCFFGFRQSTALFAHEVHFSVLFSVSTTTADLRGLPLCSEHDSLCLNSSATHKAIHLSFIDQVRPLKRSCNRG